MAEVFIRRLSRWQAEQQQEAVADVYVETYRGVPGEEFADRERFLRAFASHRGRPGFDMVVADLPLTSGGKQAGYAYGYHLDRAAEWWRGIDGSTEWNLEELTASGQVFALAELMVLPGYRTGGVATRLIDELLSRAEGALVTARVDPANEGAVRSLVSWGWTRLGAYAGPNASVPTVGHSVSTEIWCRTLKP